MILENKTLDVIEEMKLLGAILTTDMKWHSNTDYIIKKSYDRIWMMRRLKLFGESKSELIDV